jgi:acetylornithine deacetylase/succinyl-diaminopimelate desuccinylase-like protein
MLPSGIMTIEPNKLHEFVQRTWEAAIVPALTEYVRIPAKSPMFDREWAAHGHLERAVALIEAWARSRPIEGLRVEVVRLQGRTPVILMEAPGSSDDTVLLYGHCDKQPEMIGWADGLGPWTPVRHGDKLYGRGVGDDGYAAFAALTAIEALQTQRAPHARCLVLIEACEESGSYDLPFYVDALADRLGTPSLVVCLDSGCGNYEQLWGTTSLRGVVGGVLTVEVLSEGVHSGSASGIVPSSFRIARALLSRLEDERTGEILPRDFHVEIPAERVAEAREVAKVLGDDVFARFPLAPGTRPVSLDPLELILNNTWRPALAITGAAGLPLPADGGNVLRPTTSLKLSLRLPPACDARRAVRRLKEILEADPPYGARVTLETYGEGGNGWDAPATSPWLLASLDRASTTYFGKPAVFHGLGGSIPFMSMLGERFPRAQFLITGAMGPGSNAHGPNEFLHLPTGVRVTACVAQVLVDHSRAVIP